MEITLDIDKALMAELEQEAARQGRSQSEIVEGALRRYLAARQHANPPS
ncbi:MAG: CopG family transcriptional regulator [Alphaproteobacteria bacterium]|nr:CopG family transcriptional regulator [Alphaproteobacteria bacterium]